MSCHQEQTVSTEFSTRSVTANCNCDKSFLSRYTFLSAVGTASVIVSIHRLMVRGRCNPSHHSLLRLRGCISFRVRVEDDAPLGVWHKTETIGYLALEKGVYNIDGVKLRAGKVDVNHNWKQVTFPSSFSSTPSIIAQITTEKGNENCLIDLKDPSPTVFKVRVE